MEQTKIILKKTDLCIVLLLAFYNFIFLGIEYLFDEKIGLFTDSAGVVQAQNTVLGVSLFGFISYFLLHKVIKERFCYVLIMLLTLLGLVGFWGIESAYGYAFVYGAGILCFVVFGIAGSAVGYLASRQISQYRHMAKLVGISYAVGILIQFLNTNYGPNGVGRVMVFAIATILFSCLFCLVRRQKTQETQETSEYQKQALFHRISVKKPYISLGGLIFSVIFMTMIFSTLDNAVTMTHASGEFNIGQWPRLLLALSGMTAGVLYDVWDRRLMPLVMYLVTLLSVISIIIIQNNGPFLCGLMTFYITAGFFVVFFMTSFMDLSFFMKEQRLWAGIGRGINNFSAILTSAVSVYLLKQENTMYLLVLAIVLFVFITCSLLLYYYPILDAVRTLETQKLRDDVTKEIQQKKNSDHFELFVEKYHLTNREKDVLKELLINKEQVLDISKSLGMARATLYRHISSINEKTNTNSRIELIQFYHSWSEEAKKAD